MYKKDDIINSVKFDKIRVEDTPSKIHDQRDKYWVKGMFVCDEAAKAPRDGRMCNGCGGHCGEKMLFIKVYEGDDENQIKALENQGQIQILSPYIAKVYGVIKEQKNTCMLMEYVDGTDVSTFCRGLSSLVNVEERRLITSREQLVIKYRLMRQMLYAVRDYQKYRQKDGNGIHMDLKPEHFLVKKGEKWKDFLVKLIDFESFTNENQKLETFQMTGMYAHPEQIECFLHKNSAFRIKTYWDYYALGLVFYEMLEETSFYSEEEVSKRTQNPQAIKKEVRLKKHVGDMSLKEEEELTNMIRKMISLEEPCKAVEELIVYLEGFFKRWLKKSDIRFMDSPEFLNISENQLMYAPYIQLTLEVSCKNQLPFQQYYEMVQGGIVTLIYGGNIPTQKEEYLDRIAGYIYESNGQLNFINLKDAKDGLKILPLQFNMQLELDECTLVVKKIDKTGCRTFGKTVFGAIESVALSKKAPEQKRGKKRKI